MNKGHVQNTNFAANEIKDADDEESPIKKTPKSKKSKNANKDEVKVKDEPNEAGELMDDLAG